MPRTPLALLAAGIALLAASCTQTIPNQDFDARAADREAREIGFTRVKVSRKPDPALLQPPAENYQLGPGDVLEIEIAELPGTLAKTFVMPDGMIYYNLAGGVRAEGLTTAELALKLAEALRTDYADPLVNVSLVEVRSRRYWILGRVFKPGIYPLRQPTTLVEAVSDSGGLFTSRFSGTTQELADLSNSIVIRNGRILPVDFEKLIKDGDLSHNIYLRHNDFIYLPSATASSILLLGAVKVPQSVGWQDALTLVDCIAQGRGPTPEAYLDQIVIVRGSLSEPRAALVDLKSILTGREPDVMLRPGDIVWIPKRPMRLVESTLELVFKDAARAAAAKEGARFAGSEEDPVITIPLGSP
jgi:polysaccharide biosynthesis/export protein